MALVSIKKQTEVINQNTNLATVEDIDAVRLNMVDIRGAIDRLENSLKEITKTDLLPLAKQIGALKSELKSELRYIRWLLVIASTIIITAISKIQ